MFYGKTSQSALSFFNEFLSWLFTPNKDEKSDSRHSKTNDESFPSNKMSQKSNNKTQSNNSSTKKTLMIVDSIAKDVRG